MYTPKFPVIPVRSGRIELPQSFDHQNLNKEESRETRPFFAENDSEAFSGASDSTDLVPRQRRAPTRKRNAAFCGAPVLVTLNAEAVS